MIVLVADKMPEFGLAKLKEIGCEVIFEPDLKDAALTEAVARTRCGTLIVRSTKLSRATFEAGSGIQLVIRAGSGYDTIDVACATERNVRVCNCPGMNAVAVAELVIGLMISLDRRIVDQAVDLRRGVWNKKQYSGFGRGLKGRTLGIVGLGKIGYEVGKRAAAFEMKLLYSDVVIQPAFELAIDKVSLDEILSESDFITLHVPGGGGTKHFIGEAELAKMKPTAYLINCSRGGVVDQVALANAIDAGTIGGAGLDVYEQEPAATDKAFSDPIVGKPGIYGTHHVGASTAQAQAAVAEEAVKIVQQFVGTGELLHCVNAAG